MKLSDSLICENEEIVAVGERSVSNLIFRFLIFCPIVFIFIGIIMYSKETMKSILSETNIIGILLGTTVIVVNSYAFFDCLMSDVVITNRKVIFKKLWKIHIIQHENINEVELFKIPVSTRYRWLNISSKKGVYLKICHLTTASFEEIERVLTKYTNELLY